MSYIENVNINGTIHLSGSMLYSTCITIAPTAVGATMQILTTGIKIVPSSYNFPFNVGIIFYQNSGVTLNVRYRVDILCIGNVKI